MSVWFVSRHPGAVAWAREEGLVIDHVVSHLAPDQVRAGDTVIGTLPIHLAAQVCDRGATYLHLSLDLPAEWRGRELDATQLRQAKARLEPFHVHHTRPAPHDDHP
ncbi:MAG: hypothetical protein RLZZ182_2703 [Pseudomonadota bacterium]|jgi:CRISPR-associated protein Csx16